MAGNRRPRTAEKVCNRRFNVMLRDESITRLMLHVVMMGKNPGDLLSDLIDEHLREYRVQKNTARGTQEDSATRAEQGECSSREAA